MKYSTIMVLEKWYDDFPDFVRSIQGLLSRRGEPFEIIIIANGTGGFLKNELKELSRFTTRQENVRAFEFNMRTTQAVCFKAGYRESSGEIIIGCESYQQITDDSFNRLLDAMLDGVDIVVPWRQHRVDPSFNQFQSRSFNLIANKITKSDLHDLSCTVRVFRREVLQDAQLYGNMYRFLPILAARRGFKYKEVKCDHLQERGKTGFYSFSEYATRLVDILTLYFNTHFSRKPVRFFGSIGMLFMLSGVLLAAYVIGEKVMFQDPIGQRVTLIIALLLTVLGVQEASVGLLGEIIAFTHGRHNKEYTIEKII